MITKHEAQPITPPTSYRKVREIVTLLNRVNLATTDFQFLLQQVDTLIHGMTLTFHAIPHGTNLFRGVIHKEKPTSVSYLGHPPANKVNNYQRCNVPNKPMFYGSCDISAILFEINAQLGDKVYISKWTVEKEFFYSRVPPVATDSNLSDLAFSKIETFFETRFSQPVGETFSEQYKLTAAIAQKLTTGTVCNNEDFLAGRSLGGLVYPSVAHPGRSDNIAIQANVAQDCLRLINVCEVEVIDKQDDAWHIREIDFSSKFDDEKITWSGHSSQWKVGPDEALTFSVENNRWVARSQDGRIVEPT